MQRLLERKIMVFFCHLHILGIEGESHHVTFDFDARLGNADIKVVAAGVDSVQDLVCPELQLPLLAVSSLGVGDPDADRAAQAVHHVQVGLTVGRQTIISGLIEQQQGETRSDYE